MLDKYLYAGLHFIMKYAGQLNSWAWRELVKILKSAKCKINIIPYNETDGKYKRPADDKINSFVETLASHNNNNFQIMVRWSNGLDIEAGCGQLAIIKNNIIKGE